MQRLKKDVTSIAVDSFAVEEGIWWQKNQVDRWYIWLRDIFCALPKHQEASVSKHITSLLGVPENYPLGFNKKTGSFSNCSRGNFLDHWATPSQTSIQAESCALHFLILSKESALAYRKYNSWTPEFTLLVKSYSLFISWKFMTDLKDRQLKANLLYCALLWNATLVIKSLASKIRLV